MISFNLTLTTLIRRNGIGSRLDRRIHTIGFASTPTSGRDPSFRIHFCVTAKLRIKAWLLPAFPESRKTGSENYLCSRAEMHVERIGCTVRLCKTTIKRNFSKAYKIGQREENLRFWISENLKINIVSGVISLDLYTERTQTGVARITYGRPVKPTGPATYQWCGVGRDPRNWRFLREIPLLKEPNSNSTSKIKDTTPRVDVRSIKLFHFIKVP